MISDKDKFKGRIMRNRPKIEIEDHAWKHQVSKVYSYVNIDQTSKDGDQRPSP